MGRMLGLILALLLTIAAPSAGAVVLLEGPEPNDCPCEATPGGTIHNRNATPKKNRELSNEI